MICGVPSCLPATRSARQDEPSRRLFAVVLRVQQQVRDRALAGHPAATVETWLRAGERLTEAQAAAIAFDEAPLDGLCP